MLKQMLVLGVAFSLLALPGAAQVSAAKPSQKMDVDVFGGYSRSLLNVWRGSGNVFGGENGFEAAADFSHSSWIAVTADVAGYFSSYDSTDSSKAFTYLAGPKFKLPTRSSPVKPFADVLVGGAHVGYSGYGGYSPFKTPNSVSFAADGGIDYWMSHHLAVRAQAGYWFASFKANDSEVQKNIPSSHVRVSTGIVYRF